MTTVPGYPADMDIVGMYSVYTSAEDYVYQYKEDTKTTLPVSVVQDFEPRMSINFLVVLGDSWSMKAADRFEVQYTA